MAMSRKVRTTKNTLGYGKKEFEDLIDEGIDVFFGMDEFSGCITEEKWNDYAYPDSSDGYPDDHDDYLYNDSFDDPDNYPDDHDDDPYNDSFDDPDDDPDDHDDYLYNDSYRDYPSFIIWKRVD